MKQLIGIGIILYLYVQKRSTEFYAALSRKKSHLNVPGMVEFIISYYYKLRLMPRHGIAEILNHRMPHFYIRNDISRNELYLRSDNATAGCYNVLKVDARPTTRIKSQNLTDPERHIIAFAETTREIGGHE